jgi:hypothetical protein
VRVWSCLSSTMNYCELKNIDCSRNFYPYTSEENSGLLMATRPNFMEGL